MLKQLREKSAAIATIPPAPMPAPVSEFAPRPRVQPLSEQAAQVADNIERMHKEISQLTMERDQFHQEARVLAAELQSARAEVADLRSQRDYYQRQVNRVEAISESVAEQIIKLIGSMKQPIQREPVDADALEQEIEQAVTEIREQASL